MPSTTTARTGCVVVAAGSGSRLGAGVPKAFVDLGGRPLLVHAVSRVLASGAVGHVVVVVPEQWLDRASGLVSEARASGSTSGTGVVGVRAASGPGDAPSVTVTTGSAEAGAGHGDVPTVSAGAEADADNAPSVTVVAGGAERQDSVAIGLAALPDDVDVVLVHDAARCLAPPSLVARVVRAVRAGHAAVVPGLPVADTIKLVGDSHGNGGSEGAEPVRETVDRSRLRIAQTPQGFDRATLDAAHAAAATEAARAPATMVGRAGDDVATTAKATTVTAAGTTATAPLYTDDAEMAELVTEVTVVPGDPLAFKITGPQDLAYAGWLLSTTASDADTAPG